MVLTQQRGDSPPPLKSKHSCGLLTSLDSPAPLKSVSDFPKLALLEAALWLLPPPLYLFLPMSFRLSCRYVGWRWEGQLRAFLESFVFSTAPSRLERCHTLPQPPLDALSLSLTLLWVHWIPHHTHWPWRARGSTAGHTTPHALAAGPW